MFNTRLYCTTLRTSAATNAFWNAVAYRNIASTAVILSLHADAGGKRECNFVFAIRCSIVQYESNAGASNKKKCQHAGRPAGNQEWGREPSNHYLYIHPRHRNRTSDQLISARRVAASC